ncbi:MAG: response regulator [Actinobacteria bacterium]|nr:response regulator [Actinomycetota bacterium]MCA1719624.1 response regulator [Actinomycetota bacterium]
MRVFVCDDDAQVGAYLQTSFELEGWTVRLFGSGEELLAGFELAEPPDAIVLDQVMPGLTGIETATRLRDEGLIRPIILCSGFLGPQLNGEIARLHLTPVNKVDMDALVRVVRAAVDDSRRPARRRR